jgi:hypothetical protein
MSEEKQFADGLIAKHPGENAPDFVKAKLSFKLDEFKQWVGSIERSEQGIEWLNVEVKESKGGKWYAERVIWKPAPEPVAAPSFEEKVQVAQDVPW